MIQLTWRQHRIEISIMAFILLIFAGFLLITGANIASEAQKVGAATCISHRTACLQAQMAQANYVEYAIMQNPAFSFFCMMLPLALPVLVGMFIGAPAIAREFEQGTYRLIWVQGIPWSRWLSSKVGLITGVVGWAFVLLFGMFTWWNIPILNMPFKQGSMNDFSTFFDSWGVVLVAYALFALMLGIFLGVAMRKVVPAMALTLIIFVVVRVLIVSFWRPSYLPPVVVTTPLNAPARIPGGSWIIQSEIVDRQGQQLSINTLQVCESLLSQPTEAAQAQYNHCISEHGFQSRTVYQPANRYWLFQGIESGIYLSGTVLLFVLTFWWIRYRIIGMAKRNRRKVHQPEENISAIVEYRSMQV